MILIQKFLIYILSFYLYSKFEYWNNKFININIIINFQHLNKNNFYLKLKRNNFNKNLKNNKKQIYKKYK